METARFDPLEELRPVLARQLEEPVWEDSDELTSQPLCFDSYRIGDELRIDFDVPGVHPSTIELTLEHHVLTVAVERGLPSRGVDVIERGRLHGKFKRSLLLPAHWDVEHLTADVDNGVLSIRAPWTQASGKRSVEVTRHGQQTFNTVVADVLLDEHASVA